MAKFLSVKQAAEKLGINAHTLRRWDRDGKFTSVRHPVNNYRVYTEEQVNILIKEMEPAYQLEPYDTKQSPTAYHKTEYGSLYNIDAIELLRSLPNNSIDLIIADPPYNIGKAEWDIFPSQNFYLEWTNQWINESYRVLTTRGSMYICGFSEILADIKYTTSKGFHSCKWLVWFYRNKANLGNDWGRSHESILHLRKSRNFIFNIDEVRIPYNEHTIKYPNRSQAVTSQYGNGKSYDWVPNPKGAKPKDVFEIPTISNSSWEKTLHPTQKPIELISKLILASSNQDSIIVDPFGGSGTTYMIADVLKRNWIGSEINTDYCSLIIDRLEDMEERLILGSQINDPSLVERRLKLRGDVKSPIIRQ
ncbi:MAG TPA: DNA methyltransferase [Candidatus Cloacimonadota bacterium]|mgnify:CR=1 FL=1|nr:DNA methyltransferase [Candidatus Cloacimonadota bacterium]HPT72951.1 DNA methyltransferase [Candidatus Cloacimonadota bacterium]